MGSNRLSRDCVRQVNTPSFVISEHALKHNLDILKGVKETTGCTVLLALKAFACPKTFDLISSYLDGVCASGLYEAKLGKTYFNQVHTFSPCFKPEEFEEILSYSDHVVFNSLTQLHNYKDQAKKAGKQVGLRINPEYAEVTHEIYNPCSSSSSFGVKLHELTKEDLEGVDGLHFHALCQQGADTLKRVMAHVEEKFGPFLKEMKWLNIGGGHHITREDYDIDLLCSLIKTVKEKYDVQVIIEPGEAVALNAGYLVTTVGDIKKGQGVNHAMLDSSAVAHVSDVIEMPFTPQVQDAITNGKHKYAFSGNTCMAGDKWGTYSFDKELQINDRVVFTDMAHYSMVKTNSFNGVQLPSIYYLRENNELQLVKNFGYQDFLSHLG